MDNSFTRKKGELWEHDIDIGIERLMLMCCTIMH